MCAGRGYAGDMIERTETLASVGALSFHPLARFSTISFAT